VLEAACPECGFVAADVDVDDVAAMLRANADAWTHVLRSRSVAQRPSPAVWSPLEYACHVRDVNRLYLVRLNLMLAQDGPHYPNWDQDRTAIDERYHEADPAEVAEDLTAAAMALADRFDEVAGDQWDRTGYRSDGAAFTISSFARYLIHDPIHHLHDVGGTGS
jgi:hypothetical protein